MHLLFGAQWQVPLVLALFIALLLGVCLGVFVMLPLWLRARKSAASRAKTVAKAAESPTTRWTPPRPLRPHFDRA